MNNFKRSAMFPYARDEIINVITWISIGLAAATIVTAAMLLCSNASVTKQDGKYLVAFWLLAPPLWFFYEWVLLAREPNVSQDKLDHVKQLHELARNIWLAVVAVLVAIFELDVFH